MKTLKFLEKLYRAQIGQLENPEMFNETPRVEGIVIGLKMALQSIQEEIKKLQVK